LGKRKVPLFLLSLLTIVLLITTIASVGAIAAPKLKIVIDLSHGQGPSTGDWTGHKLEREAANFEGNLTAKGYQVVWATEISESVLADAQFLFLGSVYGKNLTDAEVDVIVNWFRQGEKTIWVAADSDYGGYRYIVDNTNKVLRTIGSKIRAEPTAAQDPYANCGKAGYRLRANVTNVVDSEVAAIVSGVDNKKGVLFHGPTILYGFVNGTAVALETTKVKNVYWVMKTGASGIIVDADPTVRLPIAHEDGQQGSFVIMAVERYAGPNGNCKIIVTGENPYGGYQPMFSSAYYGEALDGSNLVMNAVSWGVKVEYESDKVTSEISQLKSTIATQASEISKLKTEIEGLRSMIYAAIGVAIIGIIVGAVGIFVKKK